MIMSTKNTVTNGQTKNKGRQIGPFSYYVNTMVIMSTDVYMPITRHMFEL